MARMQIIFPVFEALFEFSNEWSHMVVFLSPSENESFEINALDE